MAYWNRGYIYGNYDIVKCIDNFQKAISLNRGSQLPTLLGNIGGVYQNAQYIEKSKYYNQEAFNLDGDSSRYQSFLASLEGNLGNFANAIKFYEKIYATDTNNTDIQWSLGYNYMLLGQYKDAFKYYKEYIERLKPSGSLSLAGMHRIGYVYWQNGYKKEAEYYFDKQIEYANNEIKLERERSIQLYTYYDLAGVYAFRGEKDKAYENLRIFNQRQIIPLWMLTLIKNDPLFDSLRNEEEFQQIFRDVEAKYQAQHESVRKWLEEQDLPG